MVRTAKRIDSTDACDTSTYSIAIIEVPNLSLVSVDIGNRQPSTTTTIGFFTRDPIGFHGGAIEIYEYCHGIPSKYVDPSGKQIYPGYPPSFPVRVRLPSPPSPPQQPVPPVVVPLVPPLVVAPQPPSRGEYGHYCGPIRMSMCQPAAGKGCIPSPTQRAPIDALDAACAAHDCCLFSWREALSECFTPACNPVLCSAMAAISCGTLYSDPQKIYECQYMKWKATALFCVGPVPPGSTM